MSSREQMMEVSLQYKLQLHLNSGSICDYLFRWHCYQALDDAARRRGQEVRASEEEVRRVEEERIQVLNNMEEVEQKIKELDNQVEESAREVKRGQTQAATNMSKS